jgi:quinol-cytochrome oxidoreductase complex cytochrome b subunit
VTPRARTAVRWLAWVGGVALIVVVVSGVWVTFRYRPDATGTTLAMVRLHKWSGVLIGPIAVAIVIPLIPRRGLRVYFAVLGVFLAWVLTSATGRRLRWDQVVVFAVTVGREVQGIFFLHHPARAVRVDGHEYSWEYFRDLFWRHAVVLPLLMAVAFVWAILWARRIRSRQPDMESSAETPAAIRR